MSLRSRDEVNRGFFAGSFYVIVVISVMLRADHVKVIIITFRVVFRRIFVLHFERHRQQKRDIVFSCYPSMPEIFPLKFFRHVWFIQYNTLSTYC